MILDWLEEWFKGVLIDGITSNLTGLSFWMPFSQKPM